MVEIPVSQPLELIAEAAMLASSGKKVVLFVEGPSDKRLFGGVFKDEVSVVAVGGWSTLEQVFQDDVVREWPEVPQIFGVTDRDYRIALGRASGNERLVYSHLRDIECEMIESDALRQLLVENFASSKLNEAAIERLRGQAIEVGRIVGSIRFWAAEKNAGLSFGSLDFSRFVDVSRENVIPAKLLQHLRGAQKSGTALPASIEECLQLTESEQYAARLTNPLRITRGHDIGAYIVLRLKKGLGRKGCVDDIDGFESQLRIAFAMLNAGPTISVIKQIFRANGFGNLVR